MKLTKISLANFKAFEQIDIDFDQELTVIAGINGIGKSSILYAISTILSQSLPEFTPATRSVSSLARSFEDEDIYLDDEFLGVFARLSIQDDQFDFFNQKRRKNVGDLRKDKTIPFIAFNEDMQSEDLPNWREILESRSFTGNLVPAKKNIKDIFSKKKALPNQPIAVYFSPNRRLPGKPRTLQKPEFDKISQAYSFALDDREVELRTFLNWFNAQSKLGKNNNILNILKSVVTKFVPEFTQLRLQEDPDLAFIVEKSGKPFRLHQLSDGERGLLAIIFDLTRRLAIANPELSDPVAEGQGIVMIDEVELHLHPTWQRQVLRRLTSTFRSCQFIVTTHSPQVIGQTKPEKLRLLHEDKGRISVAIPNQSFGMDSSWILQNIMGAAARDIKTEQNLGAIFDAIDEDDYPQARELIQAMSEDLGDFPELQEASSLLDRLELLEEAYEED
jgi:predicted ATP-binding protein involved in virulence